MKVDEGEFRALDVGLVHLEHTSGLVLRNPRRGMRLVPGRNIGGPAYLFRSLPPDPFHTATGAD